MSPEGRSRFGLHGFLEVSWPLGAKMAHRPLQEAHGIDFVSILDNFCMIFCPILYDFSMIWKIFLLIFGHQTNQAVNESTHQSINQAASTHQSINQAALQK